MNLKLLLVIDRLTNPYAGTESQLLLLVNQLLERGVEPHLVVLAQSEWLTANPPPCPVTVLGSSSIKSPFNWLRLWRVARQLRSEGFRLAHVFFNDASVLCPPVFRSLGIKTIISRRDMGFWYNSTYKRVLPLTGRWVAKVVVNSRAVGEITKQVEKFHSSKVCVIYNGYSRLDGLSEVKELAELKARGATIMGVVANIRPIKRMQDAILALSGLITDFPELNLVIIGSGDSTQLSADARAYGVENNVHFLGARSDIPSCLQYFDIGLLCSESEGFSNAIVEYQFAGLPVICSHTGGNPEAVEHGDTGLLYPVANIAALEANIRALLLEPETRQAMGISAKETASERYSVISMADNHLKLYREVLAKCS